MTLIMTDCIRIPFSYHQVEALNLYQLSNRFHPFCCFGPNKKDHPLEAKLVATVRGWICPYCDYTQYWAHEFMVTIGEEIIAERKELTKQQKKEVLEHLSQIRKRKSQ